MNLRFQLVAKYILLALIALTNSVCWAQLSSITADVAPPMPGNHDYIRGLNETVNPGNGSVNVSIQLPMPSGRLLTVPLSIDYNSDQEHAFMGQYTPTNNSNLGDNQYLLGQGGWRPRMFTYNSLSTLTTGYNPESGQITYTYDANGNMITKTGARGITETRTYDPLNRMYSITYSDGSPSKTFVYDVSSYGGHTITNPVGHRVAVTSTNGASEVTSYDSMGRHLTTWQCIPGVSNCQTTAVNQYNFAGAALQMTYPNGLLLNYGYDNAGRQQQVSDSNGNLYAQSALYWPNGNLQQFSTPNFNYTWSFNNRFQPSEILVGNASKTLYDKKYGYGTANNGSIVSITNVLDNTRSQAFAYDTLSRVVSAHDGAHWSNTYTYDAWGNLTAMTPGAPTGQLFSSSATAWNQLNGLQYDAEGNVKNDGAHSYTMDAGNHVIGVDSNVSFVYDADGRRVQKSTGTNYWHGTSGGVLAETDSNGNWTNYIFFGGHRLARSDSSGINYNILDHLDSTSMYVTQAGTVVDDQDYSPFGAPMFGSSSSSNHYKFTAKERDGETGSDYFGARFYGNNMGRFFTPDFQLSATTVPFANLGDPQSLNQYGYVQNRAPSNIDFGGHGDCNKNTWEDKTNTVHSLVCPLTGNDLWIIGSLATAWGHHFVDRSIVRNKGASDLAAQFFKQWMTGPLQNPGQHKGFTKEHILNSAEVKRIVAEVEKQTGRPMDKWTEADIRTAVAQLQEAGQDPGNPVGAFVQPIATDNPGTRTIVDSIESLMTEAKDAVGSAAKDVINMETEFYSNPANAKVVGEVEAIEAGEL